MLNGCYKLAAASHCYWLKVKASFKTHPTPIEQQEVYRHCPELVCIVCKIRCTLKISQIMYLILGVWPEVVNLWLIYFHQWNGMFTDLLLKGVADRPKPKGQTHHRDKKRACNCTMNNREELQDDSKLSTFRIAVLLVRLHCSIKKHYLGKVTTDELTVYWH